MAGSYVIRNDTGEFWDGVAWDPRSTHAVTYGSLDDASTESDQIALRVDEYLLVIENHGTELERMKYSRGVEE